MGVAFRFDILVGKVIIGRKSYSANVSYNSWYLVLELSFEREREREGEREIEREREVYLQLDELDSNTYNTYNINII